MVVPAASMGVVPLPQVSRRWLRYTIALAIFALLLLYLYHRSQREWPLPPPPLAGTQETRSRSPKAPLGVLTAPPCLSPGGLSGCGSGAQPCVSEGPPPSQVRCSLGAGLGPGAPSRTLNRGKVEPGWLTPCRKAGPPSCTPSP